jgi:hypothetical protein
MGGKSNLLPRLRPLNPKHALPINPGTSNIEHRTLNIEGVSPFTLRLLSPLGEEREKAGAAFLV